MNPREIKDSNDYVLDGETLASLFRVVARLYDESRPLVVNERRDIAQRLDALLRKAVELPDNG